jgi:hypothetical protein
MHHPSRRKHECATNDVDPRRSVMKDQEIVTERLRLSRSLRCHCFINSKSASACVPMPASRKRPAIGASVSSPVL